MISQKSVVTCGLPGSGKTSYLAALWHLVLSRQLKTVLQFDSLKHGDTSHLNALVTRWRRAKDPFRTPVGTNTLVSINFKGNDRNALRVTFPDLSGESQRRMWEERECDHDLFETLRMSNRVMLFIHSDTIRSPRWVTEETAAAKKMKLKESTAPVEEWHPKDSPTQVQLVDILQLLRQSPLDIGPRKVAIMFSAWDKVAAEKRTPNQFLNERLPLLAQYLSQGADEWTWQAFGVSAQGGDYEPIDKKVNAKQRQKIDALLAIEKASDRIRLVTEGTESHDLTVPLAWLMS